MSDPVRTIVDESARALHAAAEVGVRHAATLVDSTGDAIRNSSESGQTVLHRMSDGATRSPAEAVSAVADLNRVFVEGAQEMAREWTALVQSGCKRHAERVSQLMDGGSPADLAMMQPTLAREAMENWMAAATRLTEISLRVSDRAAKAWTGVAAQAASQGEKPPRPFG